MPSSEPLWGYIKERERIRLARLQWPQDNSWTGDPILARYKFTNVKRLHDRTTQAFLQTYQENKNASAPLALYNCGVRRFFGTIDFGEAAGWLPGHKTSLLRAAVNRCKGKVWTGAYMIRAGAAGVAKVDVVAEYLGALWKRAEDIATIIEASRRWEDGYSIMRTCYGFGPFMAKEVLQDYILWLHVRGVYLTDEESFTPIGPGGRRGLNRLAGRELSAVPKEKEMLEEIRGHLSVLQKKWLKAFPKAERLTAHDVQFCLCEFDKYERVRLGQGRPRSTFKPRR